VDADEVGAYPGVRRITDPGQTMAELQKVRARDVAETPVREEHTDQHHPTACQVSKLMIICIIYLVQVSSAQSWFGITDY